MESYGYLTKLNPNRTRIRNTIYGFCEIIDGFCLVITLGSRCPNLAFKLLLNNKLDDWVETLPKD